MFSDTTKGAVRGIDAAFWKNAHEDTYKSEDEMKHGYLLAVGHHTIKRKGRIYLSTSPLQQLLNSTKNERLSLHTHTPVIRLWRRDRLCCKKRQVVARRRKMSVRSNAQGNQEDRDRE